jgi:hypothetical protein
MSERRRFFRIDDEFEVRVLPSNGGPRPREEPTSEARELGQALARLRKKLPEAADVIELLARRVAVLERKDEDTEGLSPAEMVQGTNISGCGIAIYSRQDLAPGRMLDLELLLESGAVRLRAVGRVISSETLRPSEKGWLVRIDFVDIDTADEETLVQYVMRRQLRLLRRDRDAGARP